MTSLFVNQRIPEFMKLVVPLGFSRVSDGICHSAYPATKTLPFVKSLNLKSMVCLCSNDLRSDLQMFAKENSIEIVEFDLKYNQEPFIMMSESEMQKVVLYIKSKTSAVIKGGCC